MIRWAMVLCLLLSCVVPMSAPAEEAPGDGLGLADAIRIVLQESPLSEIADAEVTAAEDGRKSARGDFLPKLRTQFEYTKLNKVPEIAIPDDVA